MNQLHECLDLLRQLVAIPSQSQNEEEHARFIAAYLEDQLGMETELQHVEGKSYNVIGRWPSDFPLPPSKLILGGHLDTVPPSPHWKTNPYQLIQNGDQLCGLGAGDMKGGLAAQLTVLKSLRAQGVHLNAEIEFVGLADEERHSIGAHAYVQRASEKNEKPQETFFLMAEPHFDNLVIGATGKVLLKLEITGKTGHASTPEKGVNAINCMASLLQSVNQTWDTRYQKGAAGSHCCLMIQSEYPGYSLNIPEHCTCLINKQLSAGERIEDFQESLQQLYHDHVGQGTLSIHREIPSYPSYQLPPDQKELTALCTLLREQFHRTPELRINQSVSDGNIFYHSLGIPTVLFGPQGVNFHTAQEYVSLQSLEQYLLELEAYLKAFYTV